MLCGFVSKSKLLYFRFALMSNPEMGSRSSSQNYFGKYFRQIIASLEDPVRKVSSIKKDDFSTPHPPKDPPDPYVPDNIIHQAFDPPRKIPKTVFRKFKSTDEVLGPNADKCKDYKNPEYFSYHRYSFVNLQRASLKLRKQRIEDQQEAESDAEFDAQLEAEWEAICEKEQERKCPTDKPIELKCDDKKKVEEKGGDLPEKECQPEAEVCETPEIVDKQEKPLEEVKEDEECRKQREEECRKERQKQRDEEACREAEERKIEEEKKKKLEERKQIEAECKKKAEENLKALEARKASETKPTDVKVQPKSAEEIKKEKTKQELELRKMVEKCKKEIIHKKRIEEKCKRVAEQRLREDKYRMEIERRREEIDAKNLAQNLKDKEECELKANKEECMNASMENELQQIVDKTEHDKKVGENQSEKAEASSIEDSKQSIETVPPGVMCESGVAVCDKKLVEDKEVSSVTKKQKDDK